MTFKIIGHLTNSVLDLFRENPQKAFIYSECPVLQSGEVYPHLIHTHGHRLQDIAHICNTIFDFVLITHENASKYAVENQKSLKIILEKLTNDVKDILENTESIEKVSKAVKRLETSMKGFNPVVGTPNQEKTTNSQTFGIFTTRLKELDSQIKDLSSLCGNIQGQIANMTGDDKRYIQDAFKKHSKDVTSELNLLKVQVKGLVEELRFDPDNPKPTELGTEENSKEILKLSTLVVPLVKETREQLERTDKTLKTLTGRFGLE